jgi:hypothetical protein
MNIDHPLFPVYYNGLKLSSFVVGGRLFNHFWYRWLHKRKGGTGKLNIRHPVTFSDKIVWLKLYHDIPNGHVMVDKYLVRQLVADRIGPDYLVPLLGHWQDANDIDFDALPDRFVAKASHGSGWNIVCEDRSRLDIPQARRTLNKWLAMNYYWFGRERPYRNCPPCIVVEKHLGDLAPGDVRDYKFFCFGGEPRYVQVDVDRYGDHRQAFYDMEWNKHRFRQLYPAFEGTMERPADLEEMQSVARKLSAGLPFARIDLFNHAGRVWFGEITFHPHGGFAPFFPPEYDIRLGHELRLPGEQAPAQAEKQTA